MGITGDKDYYDGLLDITHGSDLVTVSWNKFHDHVSSLHAFDNTPPSSIIISHLLQPSPVTKKAHGAKR